MSAPTPDRCACTCHTRATSPCTGCFDGPAHAARPLDRAEIERRMRHIDTPSATGRNRRRILAQAVSVALACVEEAQAEWKRAMLNIAALLHHDGGHWMTREMTAQEVHDACVEAWSNDVTTADARAYAAEKAVEEARREGAAEMREQAAQWHDSHAEAYRLNGDQERSLRHKDNAACIRALLLPGAAAERKGESHE